MYRFTVLYFFFGVINNQQHASLRKSEPRNEISDNVVHVCASSKCSDQTAYMRSLIRAFASRLNILWLLSYWPNSI